MLKLKLKKIKTFTNAYRTTYLYKAFNLAYSNSLDIYLHIFHNLKFISPKSSKKTEALLVKVFNKKINGITLKEMSALPSATGASFNQKTKSIIQIIKNIYGEFLPAEKEFYGLNNYDINLKYAIFAQINGLYFNLGSSVYIKDYIFIYQPNESIKDRKNILDKKVLAFFNTDKGIDAQVTVSKDLRKFFTRIDTDMGISSSPVLEDNGHVYDIEEVITNTAFSDPRHIIRVPYTEKGPCLLTEFSYLSMYEDTSKMSLSLESQVEFKIPYKIILEKNKIKKTDWTDKDLLATKQAFAQDKAYGLQYSNAIRISSDGELVLPYLKYAPYNHQLVGVTNKEQFVLIQTSGRIGNITGQKGLTLPELLHVLKIITDQHDIKYLSFGSQGRDVGNVVEIKDGNTINWTLRKGELNPDGEFIRGPVTTPRILVGIG